MDSKYWEEPGLYTVYHDDKGGTGYYWVDNEGRVSEGRFSMVSTASQDWAESNNFYKNNTES